MPRLPAVLSAPLARLALGLGLGIAGLGSSGCIAHTVRVPPAPGSGGSTLVVGTRSVDPSVGATVTRGLPVDVPVSAWERRGGTVWRAETRVRSPLPWWQRFPFDAGSDLLPKRLDASADATIAFAPVPETSDDALTDEARTHGFAHAP